MAHRTVRKMIASLVLAWLCNGTISADDTRRALNAAGPGVQRPWPKGLTQAVPGGARFDDPGYSKLFAGDGLYASKPDAIFARVSAAAERHEYYKALYLARLFTRARPDLPAGWTNRGAIARQLGLSGEADECSSRGSTISAAPEPKNATLIGRAFTNRPTSLADAAAALLLAADSAPPGNARVLVTVRNDASGLYTPTPDALARINDRNRRHWNESAEREPYRPVGVYVAPEPLQIADLPIATFFLTSAKPMKYAPQTSAGTWALIGLAGMTAALRGPANQTALDAAIAESQRSDAKRMAKEPALYAGGNVEGFVHDGKSLAPVRYQPQPSGGSEVLGLPVPMILASAGSMTNSVCSSVEKAGFGHTGELIENGASEFKNFDRWCVAKLAALRLIPSTVNLHESDYCQTCVVSPAVTGLELMLTKDDIDALAQNSLAESVQRDLDPFRRAFETGTDRIEYLPYVSLSVPKSKRGTTSGLVGFDDSGRVFTAYMGAQKMMVPAK